mmetsp:Transcript_11169/g.25378  ORF Transcript_11169/g.25378 Transcript_11169/m.25378 type:complete len:667 (+) Transcript_11169:47-2047(+)
MAPHIEGDGLSEGARPPWSRMDEYGEDADNQAAFQSFVHALEEHHHLFTACSHQQARLIAALKDVELEALSGLCQKYALFSTSADTRPTRDKVHPGMNKKVSGTFSLQRCTGSDDPKLHSSAGVLDDAMLTSAVSNLNKKATTLKVAVVNVDGSSSARSSADGTPSARSDGEKMIGKEASLWTAAARASRMKLYFPEVQRENTMHGEDSEQVEGTHTGNKGMGLQRSYTAELEDAHKQQLQRQKAKVDLGGAEWSKPIRRALASRGFELFCTAIMLANVVGMIIRLELEGMIAGEELGSLSNTGVDVGWLHTMEDIEVFFTIWFTVELIFRFWTFGRTIFHEAMSVFDILVVFGTLMDLIFTRILNFDGGMNLSVARLLRLVKVLKFARTFKAATAFTELRILLRTVLRSTMALLWALIVLSMIILTCSNFMAQLLHEHIANQENATADREWLFEHYGTASRAAYTMLEATLSGGWPNYARLLVMKVSPVWGLWWFFYVFVVIFAVIRVMGALFLTASLKAASEDEDMQALRRLKDYKKSAKQLKQVFKQSDILENADAELGLNEQERGIKNAVRREFLLSSDLDYILSQASATSRLNNYGFEAIEFRLLFDIIADGNDRVAWPDFLKSAMRLKGGVKAIDVIEILHEVELLKKGIVGYMGEESDL